MARIPQRFIDDLLDRVDIVDVVNSRIDLRKSGKNYSARCPFHDEKTPSFTVSPDKQFYYCFGCGAGGNAIGFVMDHDHLNFPEAVEALASQCGMEVPRETAEASQADNLRRRLYDIMTEADSYYRRQLRSHAEAGAAVDYLKTRGLSGAIARTFGIGFAPPGWDNLISQLCADDRDVDKLVEVGLVVRREEERTRVYDRFRNRIMFPIRDTRGRVIGFGGRVLDDSKPKYLNSPETPIFHKGRELYGLYEAHRALGQITSLIVVEGYMDVVALAQHGIHNAVATLGTAATREHLEKLFRYVSDVVFCFDGDDAGIRAARRALETCLPVMTDGRSARFLFLAAGEDPDTLVRKLGADGFNRLVTEARPLSEFFFAVMGEGIDASLPEGKARLKDSAAPLINRIPAGVFRQLMLKELSRRTDVDIDTLAGIIAPPDPEPAPEPAADDGLPAEYEAFAASQAPPDYFADDPGESTSWAPVPDERTSKARRLKFSPLQRLILLLIHSPDLRTELENLEGLDELDDPDATTLLNLCALLDEHPEYSLNHILGYWRGIYGPEEGEKLTRIVAADMVVVPANTQRDNASEFVDICAHLRRKLFEKLPPRRQLEELLARETLTPEDRKLIALLWHQHLPGDERTPELYQTVKAALSGRK